MFGGIGKIFSNPMNLMALATMNPAVIAATIGRQIVSQIGQQIIQNIGSELGLPQPMIDAAQGAFASSVGDPRGAQQNFTEAAQGLPQMLNEVFEEFNVSPVDRGNVERAAGDFERALSELMESFVTHKKDGKKLGDERMVEGGFLVQLAVLIGETLDNKMGRMAELAGEMNDISNKQESFGKIKQSNQARYDSMKTDLASKGAELQGVGQELKSLQEALSTAIKSLGEAQQGLARKN